MQTKIYPRFYQLCRYKELLINKRVAGFYIPQQSAQSVACKRGLYYQTLCIANTSYLFVYREFSLPTFLPFSKGRLCLYLDGLIKKLQDNIGLSGEFDPAVINMMLSNPIKWVGIHENDSAPDGCDTVSITNLSGRESVYYKEAGKPLLIPYYEIYFRPLGVFDV
jgi:hypothetical protein